MKLLKFDVIKYLDEKEMCILRVENKYYIMLMGIMSLISVYDKKRIRFELICSKPSLVSLCPYL